MSRFDTAGTAAPGLWPALRRILVLLALALGTGLAPARAADAQPGDWRLVGEWRSFANGEDVRTMAFFGDELWVGSQGGGLLRWRRDGSLIRQYLAPQDGLPCNRVRDLEVWRSQWYAATCEGLAVYEPSRDRWAAVSVPGLGSDALTALAVDDKDRLWVAAEQDWDPLMRLDGRDEPGGWAGGGVAWTGDLVQWSTASQASGLPSDNARDLAFWRGAMWVATEPHQVWKPPSVDGGGDTDPGHWSWLGGGVAMRTATGWTRHDSASDSSLSDSVRHLVAGEEALWAGSWGRGLAAYDGGRWTSYRDCGIDSRCLRSDYVSALDAGPDGALWIGTAAFNGQGTGVNVLDSRGTPAKADDDAWNVIRATDGLPTDLVTSILADRDAGVWFGAARLGADLQVEGLGLAHLLSDRQTILQHRALPAQGASLPDNDVTAIAKNPVSGELWVGTARGGLAVRDGSGRWRHYTRGSTGGGLASDSIADLVIEPGGIVWVATRQSQFDTTRRMWTDGGLSRFDGQGWTRMSTTDGLPSNHLSALALDPRGLLWVGTGATDRGPKELGFRGGGLALVNPQTRKVDKTFVYPVLTSNNVTDLAVSGGKLFVSTSYFFYVDSRPGGAQLNLGGGLSVLDIAAGTWRKFGKTEGLTPTVEHAVSASAALIDLRTVVVDEGGRAWLGGQAFKNGVFDPQRQPDGIVETVAPDGTVGHHRFAATGAVRSLAVDPAGRIWAGTALEGIRILIDGAWQRERAHSGGLPSDRLSSLLIDAERVWFGSAGDGLFLLAPATPATPPAPGTSPSGTDTLLRRMPFRVFLPRMQHAQEPRFVQLP